MWFKDEKKPKNSTIVTNPKRKQKAIKIGRSRGGTTGRELILH